MSFAGSSITTQKGTVTVMRGIDTQVRKNRRRIFKEVASLAYHSDNLKDDIEALPYKIIDYDES